MPPIMAIRCRFYNDYGDAIGDGCSMKQKGCSFVHPNESAWKSAMSFDRSSSFGSTTSALRGPLLTPPKFKFRNRTKPDASHKSTNKMSLSLSLPWINVQNDGAGGNVNKEKINRITEDGSGLSSLQPVAQTELEGTNKSTGAEDKESLVNNTNTKRISNLNDGSGWTSVTQPELGNTWGMDLSNESHNSNWNANISNYNDTSCSIVDTSKDNDTSGQISSGGWGSSSGNNWGTWGDSSTSNVWVSTSISSGGWGNTSTSESSLSLGGWGASMENTGTVSWGANITGIESEGNGGSNFSNTVATAVQDIEMAKENVDDVNISNSVDILEKPAVATTVANEAVNVAKKGRHHSFGLSKWDSNWNREEIYDEIDLERQKESSQNKDIEKSDSPDPSETDSDKLIDGLEQYFSKLSQKYRLGPSLQPYFSIIQAIIRGTGNYYSGSLANADYENFKRMQQSNGYSSVTNKAREILDEGRKERRKRLYKHSRRAEAFAKELTKLEQPTSVYKPPSELPKPELFLHDIIAYLQKTQRWIVDAQESYNPNATENSLRESDSLEEGEIDEESPIIHHDEPPRKKARKCSHSDLEYFETVKAKINDLDSLFESRLLDLSPKTASRIEDLYLRGANDHFQHKSSLDCLFDEKFKQSSAIDEAEKINHDHINILIDMKTKLQAKIAELKDDVDKAKPERQQNINVEQKEEFQQMLDTLKAENKKLRETLTSRGSSHNAEQPMPPSIQSPTPSDFNSEVAKHLFTSMSTVKEDVISEMIKLKGTLNATVDAQTEEVWGAVWLPLKQTIEIFQSQIPKLTPLSDIPS